MINDLRSIAVFAELARQGSFRRTASALGLSPSVVSYHISQLEKRLGCALVYRSTRKITLTHAGENLREHAQNMMTAAQQGLSEIGGNDRKPHGKLTLTLPSALTRSPLTARIGEFSRSFPEIALHILYSDRPHNLISEGIDLAIRAGNLPDSALKTRRIGQIERTLVCSPGYLNHHPTPKHPRDLANWNWIRLSMLPGRRTLFGPNKQPVTIEYTSRISVDNVEAMCQFSLQGLGLTTPPHYLVEEYLRNGELVEVLPGWRVAPIPLYALWPANAASHDNSHWLLNFLDEDNNK